MKINGYTLVEPPIQGGMALVYKGEKGSFRRAFKLVRPDKAANNPKLCQKFLQEIQFQAQLDHENIVKILDAYQYTDDRGVRATVLEMEWLNGLDLQRYIEQKAPTGIGRDEVIRIANQVLKGLIYAHSHKILHLDIKPSNLFRTTDGFIKIIDFGIARVVGENADIVNGAERLTLVTETGESTFKGTMAYASPEQQVGGKLGYTSDIYSFGKTLHFLCTGSTDPSIEVSDSLLNDIITKCTLQNPKQRYQSFEEVKQALSGNLSGNVSVKKCPHCHKEIPSVSRFCIQCGKQIDTPPHPQKPKCPKCDAILLHGSALCLSCGWDAGAGIYQQVAGYKCNKCQLETRAYNAETVKFCNHCGASANNLTPLFINRCEPKTPMIICRCHRWNDAESKYCYSCGKKLDEKVIKNDGANPEKEQVKRTKKKTSDTEKIIMSILSIALFIVFVSFTAGIGAPAVYGLYLALKQIWNES